MVLAQDLRDAVLQAAFKGNLTKQLSTDTDVQSTLDIIKTEKNALMEKKKVRADAGLPEISEEEKFFLIPRNWNWVRIGDVGIYKKGPFGSALTKSLFVPKSDNSIKVYEQKNAIQKDFSLGDYYISKDYYEDKMRSFTVESGDIIVSCAGTIGETYVMPNDIELGIINQALMRMNIVDSVNTDYFLKYFDHILKEDARKQSKGSAIKNIPPFDIFKKMLMPLPPIEEQQRIVDKINELMEKIDDYEKVEKELLALEEIFPNDMKNALLQAAMQGKLTEQLDNDSSVDEMLEAIKEEKKQLIKEKKIKKEKSLPSIDEDDILFGIPDNWRWEKIGNIADCGAGATPSRSKMEYYKDGTIPWLKTGELTDGYILECEEKITQKALKECSLRLNKKNDILIAMYGATIGKLGIVVKPITTNQACCGCTPFKGVYYKYLFYYFMSIKSALVKKAEGGAQPNISRNKIRNYLMPIPPIEEQQRIVEKLEELLPLCETL